MLARCPISLWKLLAQQALEALDLNMAEKAFVLCGKNAFHGVRLVKRLSNMSDRSASIISEAPLNPNEMCVHMAVQNEATSNVALLYRRFGHLTSTLPFLPR